MKVKVIPIVIGMLETFPKSLQKALDELEICGESKPFRLQHGWDGLQNWEESWRPEDICCYPDSSERPPTNPLPCRLGMYNTPTASLQSGRTLQQVPYYDTKQSDSEVPIMLELWWVQSTPFIVIAPRSTLLQSGNTW